MCTPSLKCKPPFLRCPLAAPALPSGGDAEAARPYQPVGDRNRVPAAHHARGDAGGDPHPPDHRRGLHRQPRRDLPDARRAPLRRPHQPALVRPLVGRVRARQAGAARHAARAARARGPARRLAGADVDLGAAIAAHRASAAGGDLRAMLDGGFDGLLTAARLRRPARRRLRAPPRRAERRSPARRGRRAASSRRGPPYDRPVPFAIVACLALVLAALAVVLDGGAEQPAAPLRPASRGADRRAGRARARAGVRARPAAGRGDAGPGAPRGPGVARRRLPAGAAPRRRRGARHARAGAAGHRSRRGGRVDAGRGRGRLLRPAQGPAADREGRADREPGALRDGARARADPRARGPALRVRPRRASRPAATGRSPTRR